MVDGLIYKYCESVNFEYIMKTENVLVLSPVSLQLSLASSQQTREI